MANKTGKGGFKDNPNNRHKAGQKNAAAVAFTRSFRELLVEQGEIETTLENGSKLKRVEGLAIKLWKLALEGQPWAVQLILEKVEGKVTQPVDVAATVTHEHKSPINYQQLRDVAQTFFGVAPADGGQEPVDTADADA